MTTQTDLTARQQSEILLNLLLDYFESEFDITEDDMDSSYACYSLVAANVWVSDEVDSVNIETAENGELVVIIRDEFSACLSTTLVIDLCVYDVRDITTEMLAVALDQAIAEGRLIY